MDEDTPTIAIGLNLALRDTTYKIGYKFLCISLASFNCPVLFTLMFIGLLYVFIMYLTQERLLCKSTKHKPYLVNILGNYVRTMACLLAPTVLTGYQ